MTRWLAMAAVAAMLVGCQDEPRPSASPSESASATAPEPQTPSASAPPSTAPPSSADPDPTSNPPAEGTSASDRTYGVAIVVPDDWERVDDDPRWTGDDGFVQLDAVTGGAGSAEDACNAMAEHGLQPYGSTPTIETLLIDGHEACLVLPSDDQAPELDDQAAIVARYPQAREISGETYAFVALYVDEPHVRAIAGTLRFID